MISTSRTSEQVCVILLSLISIKKRAGFSSGTLCISITSNITLTFAGLLSCGEEIRIVFNIPNIYKISRSHLSAKINKTSQVKQILQISVSSKQNRARRFIIDDDFGVNYLILRNLRDGITFRVKRAHYSRDDWKSKLVASPSSHIYSSHMFDPAVSNEAR